MTGGVDIKFLLLHHQGVVIRGMLPSSPGRCYGGHGPTSKEEEDSCVSAYS